jgi:hypothetical protein
VERLALVVVAPPLVVVKDRVGPRKGVVRGADGVRVADGEALEVGGEVGGELDEGGELRALIVAVERDVCVCGGVGGGGSERRGDGRGRSERAREQSARARGR